MAKLGDAEAALAAVGQGTAVAAMTGDQALQAAILKVHTAILTLNTI